MIQNKHDPTVLEAATLDVMSCMSLDPTQIQQAQQIAKQAAQQELTLGDHETRLAMGVIRDLVRRMAAMPGQRSIILVSNGFRDAVGACDGEDRDHGSRDSRQRADQFAGCARPVYGHAGYHAAGNELSHGHGADGDGTPDQPGAIRRAGGTGGGHGRGLLSEQQRSGRRVRAAGLGARSIITCWPSLRRI